VRIRRASYKVVSNVEGRPLVIRDVGPWDEFLSVTNDANAVVQRLVVAGLLPVGRRLFCYDSFAPISAEQMQEAERGFYHEPRCRAPRQAPRWADDSCTCAGRQHINQEFDPNDCSGVWDGNQVISDADPGL